MTDWPPAGFVPISEREPGPWICCAPVAAAMVGAWAGVMPATLEAAHAIRRAAGLRHAGGMRPSDVARGARRLGLELVELPRDRATIDARLADGWAVIWPLELGALPARLRRYTRSTAGGHGGTLAGRAPDGRWGWFDPMARAALAGELVDPDAMLAAAWPRGIMGAPGAP